MYEKKNLFYIGKKMPSLYVNSKPSFKWDVKINNI